MMVLYYGLRGDIVVSKMGEGERVRLLKLLLLLIKSRLEELSRCGGTESCKEFVKKLIKYYLFTLLDRD
jgi:hypothetical protein